jgi:predicted RND superfamily exporter protein
MPRLPVSESIAKRPTGVIVAVVALTVIFGAGYLLAGAEMEASEETFIPNTDIVNASREISEDFETSEMIQILVRTENGNVLLPESLVEILKVEKAISVDEQISEILLPEENPMRISSVADRIISASGLLDTIDLMVGGFTPWWVVSPPS